MENRYEACHSHSQFPGTAVTVTAPWPLRQSPPSWLA